MGGRDTEVSAATTRVLIEAAVWDPAAIRATSRRLGLVSEASQRFERRVDPEGPGRAAARAVELLTELAGARARGHHRRDDRPGPGVHRATGRRGRHRAGPSPRRRRGARRRRQAALLVRAGAEVEDAGTVGCAWSPPTWRGDLVREADLAEEVARLHGYEAVPGRAADARDHRGAERRPAGGAAGPRARTRRRLPRGGHPPVRGGGRARGAGPHRRARRARQPAGQGRRRDAADPGRGAAAGGAPQRGAGRAGTALFELGRVFRPVGDALATALDGAHETLGAGDWRWRDPDGAELPVQPRSLAFAAQGLRLGDDWLDVDDRWSVHDVLAVVDEVVRRLLPADPRPARARPVERDGFHPGRTVALHLAGHEVGLVGQLHPAEADRRDLPEPVVVGELVLEPFLRAVDAGTSPVAARPWSSTRP
jgi:phenylalanyl-tRNA synthetase beta chain